MVNPDGQVPNALPGVGNAYLGFHKGGWGVTAGPRRCRGQRARASHWSTVWTSPLTYRDTHGNKALLPPNVPPMGAPHLLPRHAQGSTAAELSSHCDLGHREGFLPPFWHPPRSKRLYPTWDAKQKCQAISRACSPESYQLNSCPTFHLLTQTGVTFIRSLDVQTLHSLVILLFCAFL